MPSVRNRFQSRGRKESGNFPAEATVRRSHPADRPREPAPGSPRMEEYDGHAPLWFSVSTWPRRLTCPGGRSCVQESGARSGREQEWHSHRAPSSKHIEGKYTSLRSDTRPRAGRKRPCVGPIVGGGQCDWPHRRQGGRSRNPRLAVTNDSYPCTAGKTLTRTQEQADEDCPSGSDASPPFHSCR
jgi:hypothetical protein